MAGTIVVTGPNGGMTRITVKQYAADHPNDHLVLLARNITNLPSDVVKASDKITFESFDMTSIESVKRAARVIAAKVESGQLPPITSLVCSAAIQIVSAGQPRVTGDGYEETIAVNHLAHFALILELLPHMAQSGQIVIVGSDSHRPDYKFMVKKTLYKPVKELVSVEAGSEPVGDALNNGFQRYGTSKLLQLMTGHELARRLKSHPTYSHLHVVMFDPGSMGGTTLLREYPYYMRAIGFLMRYPSLMNWLEPAMQVSLKEDSAATLLKIMAEEEYALAEPMGSAKEDGGAPYYKPWGEQTVTYGEANEVEKCKELWRDSADLLGYSGRQALEPF